MRAEQILAVLMDDKKFKARVDELKAAEAKLSAVRQIADTLDAAKIIEQRAKNKEQEAKVCLLKSDEYAVQRLKEIEDELKLRKAELDERAVKERSRYADSQMVRGQGIEAMQYANKLRDALESKEAELKVWEQSLGQRQAALDKRITKLNEAINGANSS